MGNPWTPGTHRADAESRSPARPGAWGLLWLALLCAVLTGCASKAYTIDDGRAVDEKLLGSLYRYGKAERVTRPAIARSAELADPDCDRQWELPFTVASSQSWDEDDRVAWVRALGVDERLTVVAAAPGAPVKPGDRIVQVNRLKGDNATHMAEWLSDARDGGKPFKVRLASGQEVPVQPFEVCRGYTRFAPPNTPDARDYHWLMSLHPLDVADADLTDDEALWMVLWSQGLSEEGGLRMKAYDYGVTAVGTLYNLFTIASGLQGAALAADAAMKAAKSAAVNVASELIKQQLISQAREYAARRIREGVTEATQQLLNRQVVAALQQAAVNRGTLSGVARIAATVFDRADSWAYARAPRLAADPVAGLSLHQKLVERGLTDSTFVFDLERLEALTRRAQADARGDQAAAALRGIDVQRLAATVESMPLATAVQAFDYLDPAEGAVAGPFSRGLIDASLTLPIESRR